VPPLELVRAELALSPDTNGNIQTFKDAVLNTITFSYNPAGQVLTATDQAGDKTTFGYAGTGDLTSVIDPNNFKTTSGYDLAVRLTSVTDPLRNTTTYVPDGIGNITKITDARGGITQFAYDDVSNLLTVTDAKLNSAMANTYDLRDRVTKSCDAAAHCTNYSAANGASGYDADDNLAIVRSGTAITTQYQYDNLNRRKEIDYDVGGSSPSNVKLTYDLGDRLTVAQDSLVTTPTTRQYGTSTTSLASGLDFMTQEVTPQGTVNYTPDKAGRRITMTAGSQAQVTYGYDDADKLKTVTPQGSSSVTKTYGDPAGRLSSVKLSNGVTVTYGYDKDSHVTSLTYKKGGVTTLGDLTYGYDPDGRRVSVGGSFARTLIPAAQTFSYNPDNSLETVGSITAQNDNNGNLTCMTTVCPEFAYDARDHVSQAGVSVLTTNYSYDAFGRRYQLTNSNGVSTYLYDGLNPVQMSSSSGTNTYLGGLDLDDHFGQSAGGVNESYLRDPLGSTVAMTDSGGSLLDQYTYDPYGNGTVSGGSSTQFQFAGRENDFNGVFYMRSRYYSPAIGRFISRDPAGLAGGINLYAYAGDSPTNFTDPTGTGLDSLEGPGDVCCYSGVGIPTSFQFDFGSPLSPIANQGGLDILQGRQTNGGEGDPDQFIRFYPQPGEGPAPTPWNPANPDGFLELTQFNPQQPGPQRSPVPSPRSTFNPQQKLFIILQFIYRLRTGHYYEPKTTIPIPPPNMSPLPTPSGPANPWGDVGG
jgi:RHS repeat-associated protein